MEALKFKTTIKCSGCVAQATPFLDQAVGEDNWKVDILNPDKVLTIETKEGISEQTIVKAVQDAGYKAERVN